MVEHLDYDTHEEKSRRIALILAGLAGGTGAHYFYIGRMRPGFSMLGLTLFSTFALIQGINAASPFFMKIGAVGLIVMFFWVAFDFIRIWKDKILDGEGHHLIDHVGQSHPTYAGFWTRAAAHMVDSLIIPLIILALMLVALVYALVSGDATILILFDERSGDEITNILQLGIGLLYYTFLTATRHMATWGKRFCGIRVIKQYDHEKISILRSFWRFVCYFFSYMTFGLGFFMAGLTKEKRALHDYLAGTIVVHQLEKGKWNRSKDERIRSA